MRRRSTATVVVQCPATSLAVEEGVNVPNEKPLKYSLNTWKGLLVAVDDMLKFDNLRGFCGIFLCTSFLIWLGRCQDPSVVTCFCTLASLVMLADVASPQLAYLFSPGHRWDDAREHQFEEVCETITVIFHGLLHAWKNFCVLRRRHPLLYLVIMQPILCLIAFLGSRINNWNLLYAVTAIIFITPGLSHHGYFGPGGVMGILYTNRLPETAQMMNISAIKSHETAKKEDPTINTTKDKKVPVPTKDSNKTPLASTSNTSNSSVQVDQTSDPLISTAKINANKVSCSPQVAPVPKTSNSNGTQNKQLRTVRRESGDIEHIRITEIRQKQ